jgi:hypothetical protein
MALKLIEGFDDGLLVDRGWAGSGSMSTGRFGGTARIHWQTDMGTYPFTSPLTGTLTLGAAIQTQAVGDRYLIDFGNARIMMAGSGFIALRRVDNDTQVAISSTIYWAAPNIWRYVEMQYTPSTGACTIKVDGATAVTGTVPTTTSVSYIGLKGPGYLIANYNFFDDLYVLDNTGTSNKTYLGDVRVQTLLPSADGSNSGMTTSTGTSHSALVKEATPNTTDYVYSPSAGVKDTYQFQDLSNITSNVYGVEVTNYAHKDAAGPASMSNVVRIAGTDYVSTSQPLSVSWTANRDLMDVNPATSSNWSASDVNNAEFGVQTG